MLGPHQFMSCTACSLPPCCAPTAARASPPSQPRAPISSHLLSFFLIQLSYPLLVCPALPCLPAGELPKGDGGSYGTSVTWVKAMDPASDVILAYKQNERLLTPDHGYPIRWVGRGQHSCVHSSTMAVCLPAQANPCPASPVPHSATNQNHRTQPT
jgi:hypothetical protein